MEAKLKDEEIVNLTTKVNVYATAKKGSQFELGEKISCHPNIAAKMIKEGWATETQEVK